MMRDMVRDVGSWRAPGIGWRRGACRWCLVSLALGVAVGVSSCREAPDADVVRLAYHHPMVSVDPHGHNDAVTGAVLSSVYEALVRLAPGESVEPCLASSWQQVDPQTWRFKLRPGVLFHDGRPVTAEDVVASLERARFDFGLPLASYLEMIEAVTVFPEDGEQVEIRLGQPSPIFLQRLAMVAIVPQLVDLSRPLGTGPYRWSAGRERGPVELLRWESYWGPRPPLERVVIRFLESFEEQRHAVMSGEIDLLSGPRRQLLEGGLPEEWREIQIPAMGTVILGINVQSGPLADPRLREAVDLAIDREALVRELFPRRGAVEASNLLPVGVAGRQVSASVPEPDLERARELVDEAGLPTGTRLELQCATVYQRVVPFLERALGAIGLDVTTRLYSYEGSYRRFTDAQSELFVFGWSFRDGDPGSFLVGLVHSRDPERRLGLLNGTGYAEAEVDAAIEQISSNDGRVRGQMMTTALNRVAADRPYLPLYHQMRLAAVRDPFKVEVHSGTWVLPQAISR